MTALAALSAYLPQGPGWLPTWQLIVAVTATLNTIGNMTSVAASRKLYNSAPAFVNPLQSRTFAIWTLTSAVVRFYAAYNIHNKMIYDIALFTYLFAFFHFGSELLIFRTARPAVPNMSPVVVASTSLVWMLSQYDFYVVRS
ncbi:Erg28-like protein [Cubamyces menziesii]|nr:Erg28-like protein [Cubamyces menziesii]